jgi:protocatechuate 3,4-dioxygenase beta subunit
MKKLNRRGVVKGLISVAGLSAVSGAMAGILTPKAAEGPFYPLKSMRMQDTDNDLVKVASKVEQAGGEVIYLSGQLKSKQGAALAGHRIEIWQCDVKGKYLHPGDDRNIEYDMGFQGFGHDVTDADGNYSFRTIKPTIYPGRTGHIHVKIFKQDRELLTTQFYIADDMNNSRDSLYRRMSAKEAQAVSMVFTQEKGRIETRLDVII